MDLTEKEIREILDLIDRSNFDFFELETGALKLSVAKHGYKPDRVAPSPQLAAQPVPQPTAQPALVGTGLRPGLIAVESPMVGTFYASPSPGAPPFIEQGVDVEADSTIGLIEVMKVFTAVSAGTAGVIADILVADGEMVEYGQVLFGIEPAL